MFNTDFASCTCVINSLIISTMKNIKILEKAFKEGKTPKGIVYCFLEQCEKKTECLRYQCTKCKNRAIRLDYAMFPDVLADGECRWFVPLRVVKMAWGFDSLFIDVKVRDAQSLRETMKEYLGSDSQYYRYKLGQLKLNPNQQAHIKKLFAEYGYENVDFDNYSTEIDFHNR